MKKLNRIFDIESPIDIFVYSLINVAIAFLLLFLYQNKDISLPIFICIGCSYFVFFVLWLFISFKPINATKSKSLTNFDILLLVFSISFLILSIFSFPTFKIFSDEGLLPCTLFVGLFISCAICFIVRLTQITRFVEVKNIELCDVISQKNLPNNLQELFIENTESREDLLFRDGIIEKIHSSITGYKGSEKQIIAITGKWGSGKTTLLKFALKKIEQNNDNIIICDSFDPWSYNDSRSMLVGMFNSIYSSLGIGQTNAKIKGMIERFANSFMVDQRISWAARLLSVNTELTALKTMINNFLLSNKKRLVVIVDNLDRISHDKFYFVYKIIAKLVDTKMTTFICLYDENLAKLALKKEDIDYKFLEKLTSRKIDVPNPKSTNIAKLGVDAFTSIIEKYYPSTRMNSAEDIDCLNTIFSSCVDLRELINLLNNFTLNFTDNKSGKVNMIDFLGVSFIKYFNYPLYDKIYENAELFIRSDISLSSHHLMLDDSKKSKLIDDFVAKYLSEDNLRYRNIMDALFPEFRNQYIGFDSVQLKEFDSKTRVCSGRHFDSYFTDNETAFTLLNMEIADLLKKEKILSSDLDKLFAKYSKDEQCFVIEELQKMTENSNDHLDLFLDYFILHYYDFSDEASFFILSARSRCASFIARLLTKTEHNQAMQILNSFNFKQIVLLSEIRHWIKVFKERENIQSPLFEDINFIINRQFEIIISQNINIYSKDHYARRITWIMLSCNSTLFKKYLNKIIDSKTIFPFLVDCFSVGRSTSGIVTVSFDKNNLKDILEINRLKEILTLSDLSLSKNKDIYQIFKKGTESKATNSFDIEGVDYKETPIWIDNYYFE